MHADDVAQVFMQAIANWSASVGEAFHAVSPAAVTLRGYAEATAAWFGKEAKLTFLPWPEWKAAQTSEEEATATWEHIARSPSSSIAKAERLLGYRPRYTSLEAVFEAVAWLIEKGIVDHELMDRGSDALRFRIPPSLSSFMSWFRSLFAFLPRRIRLAEQFREATWSTYDETSFPAGRVRAFRRFRGAGHCRRAVDRLLGSRA